MTYSILYARDACFLVSNVNDTSMTQPRTERCTNVILNNECMSKAYFTEQDCHTLLHKRSIVYCGNNQHCLEFELEEIYKLLRMLLFLYVRLYVPYPEMTHMLTLKRLRSFFWIFRCFSIAFSHISSKSVATPVMLPPTY